MTTHEQRLRSGDVGFPEAEFGATDGISVEEEDDVDLFTAEDRNRLNRRWAELERSFVDDPHDAVASADDLVVEVLDRIGDWSAEHRAALRRDWAGEHTETEDLRLALRRYRTFFQRLLST